jgi:hypothetical protein
VLIRNTAPVFGANRNPYQQPGEWQVSVSTRNLVSNDHYNGTVEQVQRQTLANYVTNRQNLVDLGISRVLTRRLTLTVGVPYVNSSWASRDPAFPLPAARHEIAQNGRGLGDISVTGRYWIFNPDTHVDWNVAAGAGLKMPTGNAREQDTFPGRTDVSNIPRYVDQSVQPGDGGWGLMMEGHAFWLLHRALLFGSGSYLANPRDTNDTPSILTVLGIPTATGTNAGLGVNSVPDQYLTRLGGSVAVWKGFSAAITWRMEGLRRYDLFGASHGWRRPGTEMFVEPGVSYSNGRHTVSFNVPLGYYYNRRPNPYTGNPGDATFPRQIFLSSYSWRFGAKAAPPVTTAPAADAPGPGDQSGPARSGSSEQTEGMFVPRASIAPVVFGVPADPAACPAANPAR